MDIPGVTQLVGVGETVIRQTVLLLGKTVSKLLILKLHEAKTYFFRATVFSHT